MKFLIQKIDNKVVHDFSFTLLESIRYQNWLQNEKAMEFKYFNSHPSDKNWYFKPFHQFYVPVGTIEFVTAWFQRFHNHTPKPINVPEELFFHPSYDFTKRQIKNGNHMDFENVLVGKYFVKCNSKIKGYKEVIELNGREALPLPAGEYQVSEYMNEIDSEWRVFVYQGKLVGLQNYSGDFTKFPYVGLIKEMIGSWKSAPIAYTLDVGVGKEVFDKKYGYHLYNETFVIECHDFFSCGLYGFADHAIYPYMLTRWHYEYLKNVVYGKL